MSEQSMRRLLLLSSVASCLLCVLGSELPSAHRTGMPAFPWATALAATPDAVPPAVASLPVEPASRPGDGRRRGGEGAGGQGGRKGPGGKQAWTLPEALQGQARFSVVQTQPGADGVHLNFLSDESRRLRVQWREDVRTGSEPPWVDGPEVDLRAGVNQDVTLTGWRPGRSWSYRIQPLDGRALPPEWRQPQRARTQRLPGQSFSFTLQGDSHPERAHQFDPRWYLQTLDAVRRSGSDFHLLMGDDFSVDTLGRWDEAAVAGRYALQRPFLGWLGREVPIFLVNGNHEQASSANHDGTPDNVAVWAQNARHRFYPQPAPGGIYTGNAQPVPHIGLLRNYFAWTWGDALFVVIDPYWHSDGAADNELGSRDKKGRDLWRNTLGDAQYHWLRQTLEQSQARYKFVFAHHVLGTGRGGVEMAGQHEWGGQVRKGEDSFAQRRPGWPEPIHALMVRTGVSIFFQGHDHVYAVQEKDGVVYQTLPEPADPTETLYFADHYRSGQLLPNSGWVQVDVTPERARVRYWRTRGGPDVPADTEPAHVHEVKPRPLRR